MSASVVGVVKRPRSSDRIEQRFPKPSQSTDGLRPTAAARVALLETLTSIGLSGARARAYTKRIDACLAIPEGCRAEAIARIVSDVVRAAGVCVEAPR